jgi:hypothetical protein
MQIIVLEFNKGNGTMNLALSACPVCGQQLAVSRYHCGSCDTTIDGRFEPSALPGLSAKQIEFVRTFVRCEGKINRMEGELGQSYPTIRNRLHEVIRALGYEPGKDEAHTEATRRQSILDQLEEGKISPEEASEAIRK